MRLFWSLPYLFLTSSVVVAVQGDPALTYKGNNGWPRDAFPLGNCQGDCDNDNDCQGDLKCYQRSSYQDVPGCSGSNAHKGQDFCYQFQPASFCNRQLGFCVKDNGHDQNHGVVKLSSQNFYDTTDNTRDQAKVDECLNLCASYTAQTVTACEMIWDESNRGCYAHTQAVSRGNNKDHYSCYIKDDGNCQYPGTCQESTKTQFCPRQEGICVKQNGHHSGHDQNHGVIKLAEGHFPDFLDNTDAQVQWCLDLCACYDDKPVTGCEMSWNKHHSWQNGCFVHTEQIDRGSNIASHNTYSCHLAKKANEPCPGECDAANKNIFCARQKGFCVKLNGHDQNHGVYKLADGDFKDVLGAGRDDKMTQWCLDLCACYDDKPVTGCEMIWDQHNRGCYVHTQEIAKGNMRDRHSCYLAANSLEDCPGECKVEDKQYFCTRQKGFCVKHNGAHHGHDQNSGVYKLADGDFKDVLGADRDDEMAQWCLDLCACYDDKPVTGCEMIWDQGNRGCYVHTQQVSRGNHVDRYSCYLAANNQNECPGECDASTKKSFCARQKGFCVKANGHDQNSGVYKLADGDFEDVLGASQNGGRVQWCLDLCACYDDKPITGCEMIWDQGNRGCYVHTQEIAKGNYHDRHSCYLVDNGECPGQCDESEKPDFSGRRKGFCVKQSGHDQNHGVIKLADGSFKDSIGSSLYDQGRVDDCLDLCACYDDATVTACEMVWNNRHGWKNGCYAHTQEVARGSNHDKYSCYLVGNHKWDQCAENEKVKFTGRRQGNCIKGNGLDQNEGVIKLGDGSFKDTVGNTDDRVKECLDLCACYGGANVTACEMVWDSHNHYNGCYAHTKQVNRANNQGKASCYIADDHDHQYCAEEKKVQFSGRRKGFCVKQNGGDQNHGVIRLGYNNYKDTVGQDTGRMGNAVQACLDMCACYEGATVTACEMIWDQGNKGCYAHTQAVARGNNVDRHSCYVVGNHTWDQCQEEDKVKFSGRRKGFCVKANGHDQNDGVIKLGDGNYKDVLGNTDAMVEECLKLCACYEFATVTGCEMIWDQSNQGCYAHTKEIARGNYVSRHSCYVVGNQKWGNCLEEEKVKFNNRQTGYCVSPDGNYQDEGVIKLGDGNFKDTIGNQNAMVQECLNLCACYEGANVTACEMVWDYHKRGCYAHTKVVTRARDYYGKHSCHIAKDNNFEQCTEEKKVTFSGRRKGFCVKQNGGDQNHGVIKLGNGDYKDTTGQDRMGQAVKDCLDMCACYEGATVTACEMIWNQGNRGCYAHTQAVARGNNVERHSCYLVGDHEWGECTDDQKTSFSDRQRGFCVKANGHDQNDGVIKLGDGNYKDTGSKNDAVEECLKLCACYKGAPVTGCEMIWDQGNRGCYVHTNWISRGNGRDRHSCYLANGGANFKGTLGRVCSANAWGDPHLVTWDGLRYDAQPKGEAIFLKSLSGSTLEIQGRLQKVGSRTRGAPAVTTGIAIRGHNSSQPVIQVSVPVPARVEFGARETGFCVKSNGGDQNSGVIKLDSVNFFDTTDHRRNQNKVDECLEKCSEVEGATGCEMIWDQSNRGCYAHTREIARGNGVARHTCYLALPTQGCNAKTTDVAVRRHGRDNTCKIQLIVDGVAQDNLSYDDGFATVKLDGKKIKIEYEQTLMVEMRLGYYGRCLFSTDFHLFDCDSHKDSAIGLLGSPNGNSQDDWMMRNGSVIDLPNTGNVGRFFFAPAFNYVKENWIITDESESLFSYSGCDTFANYTEADETYDPELENVVNNPNPLVKQKCGDDIMCLMEGELLGVDAAEEHLDNPASHRVTVEEEVKPGTRPPTNSPTLAPTASPTASPTTPRVDLERNGGNVGGDSDISIPRRGPQNCPEDILLLAHTGVKSYPDETIRIVKQDTTTVTIQLHQSFTNSSQDIDKIFYQYKYNAFNTKCYEEDNFVGENALEMTIHCNSEIGLLEFWVADDLSNNVLSALDDAVIPDCCHPTVSTQTPVTKYVVGVRCVTACHGTAFDARGFDCAGEGRCMLGGVDKELT